MKKHIIKISLSLLASFLLAPTALNIANQNPIAAKAVTVLTTRSSQSYIDNYYSTISNSETGNSLKYSLETLLKAERIARFDYDNLQSNAFPYTDVDPNRPNDGYIVSFYSGTPVKGYSGMNKEHTWPKSHGGGKIDNDPHVIRPTLTSENSARGNQYFAEAPNIGWDPASFKNEKYRGISARVIFYGGVIGASSGLIIEDVERGQDAGTGNRMGKLGDLLKWNLEYPVDVSEIIRNETLDISLDYNRNPFIDDPSLACRIWGDTNANTKQICSQSSSAPETMSLTPSSATINIGNTQTLSVGVTPSEASKNVMWSSANQAIATVSNGVVTPVSVGVTTITATSTLDNSVKASATITVTNDPIPVTGVSLDKTSANLTLNSSLELNATIFPSGATNKNLTWTSANQSVATVSNSGLVTALALGSSEITVRTNDGNYSASAIITVIEQAALSSITGSFYNTSSVNTTGDKGVTEDNINKGISSYNALGFGGANVVSSLKNVSQAYFPRSSGLALGSNNNPGTMTLVLNADFHAYKVEALFNNAGISGTTVSVGGNRSVKATTLGQIGTANSNPSTGKAFIVEFNEAVSEITIETSKRTALVELIIYYGATAPTVTPLEEANNWALDFLDLTMNGCANESMNELQASWDEAGTSYNKLSEEAKNVIEETIANGEGDAIQEALARYIIIVNKYGFAPFVEGINVSAFNSSVLKPQNSNSIIQITTILVFGLSFAAYFALKKRSKHN